MKAINLTVVAILSTALGNVPDRGVAGTSTDLGLNDPPVTATGIAAAAARAKADHCQSSPCKAISTIDGILTIEEDREIHEGMIGGSVLDNGQSKIAQRRMDRLLFSHPELYGPVCSLAVKMFSRIHLRSDMDALSPAVTLLEYAVDIDLHNHGHCARDLIRALPKTPENNRIRIGGRNSCIYDDVRPPRPRAACDALATGTTNPG